MALSIKTDPSRAGGGYALLEGPGLSGVTAISVENGSSGQFLGEDGRWKKAPFAFPVEAMPTGALSLGPHIVDFVPTELLVALHAEDGRELGRLFWTDVLPSRNPGSVTSAHVYAERRRVEKAAEDAVRADQEAAQRAAEEAERQRAEADAAAQFAKAKADAAAAEQAAALERERELARRHEDADRKRQEETERKTDPPRPAWGRWAAVGLLVLILGAAAAFALVPALRDLVKPSPTQTNTQTQVVDAPRRPPDSAEPDRPPVTSPPQPAPIDCTQKFGGRLKGVRRLSDGEKVALGQEALSDGCGLAAFNAFDAVPWDSSEEAAWNVARFYDPNETRPVYRNVVQTHPDWAAVYYHYWRERSPRQSAALRTICTAANTGGASLRRSCAR